MFNVMCSVPNNLNWENVKVLYLKKFKKELKPFQQDQLRVLFQQIIHSRSSASDADRDTKWYKRGFAILNAIVLKDIMSNYKWVLETALKLKLIHSLKNIKGHATYQAGKISKRYKINNKLFPKDSDKIGNKYRKEKITYKHLLTSLEKHFNTDANIVGKPVFQAMNSTMKQIRSNVGLAKKYLQSTLDNFSKKSGINPDEVIEKQKEYERALMQLESFHQKIRFKVDDYGRVHTNLTNLKKLVRRFCYFKKYKYESYSILDFPNFQPWLLSQLLDPNFRKVFKHHLINLEHVFDNMNITEDMERFKGQCEAGSLWDDLSKTMNLDREIVKKGILAYAYGRNIHKTKFSQLFETLYPNMANLIKTIKSKSYLVISHLMMKLESDLMFNVIAKTLIEKYNFKLFATIHDSFFILKRDRTMLNNIITSELKLLGINAPKIKDEGEPTN